MTLASIVATPVVNKQPGISSNEGTIGQKQENREDQKQGPFRGKARLSKRNANQQQMRQCYTGAEEEAFFGVERKAKGERKATKK